MKLQESIAKGWLYCTNLDASEFSSNYKLHIALSMENFSQYHKMVYEILKTAVEQGIIPGFKMLNKTNGEHLQKLIGSSSSEVSINDDSRIRLYNSPFTIYLYENSDIQALMTLCLQIESGLGHLPEVDRKHISIADLQFTSHLTFRQENLNGEYVKISGAPPEVLEELKKQGSQSAIYNELVNAWKSRHYAASSSSTVKSESLDNNKKFNTEREQALMSFYNQNYGYYKREIYSKDINHQFQAACSLLNINEHELRQAKDKETWLKLIVSSYRQRSKFFHPDKFNKAKNPKTLTQATKLTALLNTAKTILQKIAENPGILNHETLLKQQAYRPKYQYELNGVGPLWDCWNFVGLVSEDSYVYITKYWEHTTQPCDIDTDGSQSAVQLYIPKITVYSPQDAVSMRVNSCEAFYYLFLAGATPSRFSGSWMSYLFLSNELLNKNQRWLLEKILTTNEFIAFTGTDTLISWAKRATREGILNIGLNATEIFIYYYDNGFDLNGLSIKLFLADNSFDKEKVKDHIIANPQNLCRIKKTDKMDEYVEIHPELKEYITSTASLAEKLSSYYIHQNVLKPTFKDEPGFSGDIYKLTNLREIVIKELLYGGIDLLSFLSTSELISYCNYIKDSPLLFNWISDPIYQELTRRESKEKTVAVQAFHAITRHCDPTIDAEQTIKQLFLKHDASIASSLNNETLIWLAKQEEVHWSRYLPIAEALIQQGDQHNGQTFLNIMIEKLGLAVDMDKDLESRCQLLKKYTKQLEVKQKESSEKMIARLIEQYKKSMLCDNTSERKCIEKQLAVLGGQSLLYNIQDHFKAQLKMSFHVLLDRLRNGEQTDTLREEFSALRENIKKINLNNRGMNNWKDITEKDSSGQWLMGGEIYRAMKQAIGVTDRNAIFYTNSYENENESEVKHYGLSESTNMLERLQRLYFVYECLSEPKEFYKNLCSNTDEKCFSMPVPTEFDPDWIKSGILNYLTQELTVIADAKRNAAKGLQGNRFIGGRLTYDAQNIKSPGEIAVAFINLGMREYFERQLLPKFYAKLSGMAHTDYALKSYAEIRRHTNVKHGVLEQKATYKGYLVLNSVFRPSKHTDLKQINHKSVTPDANNQFTMFAEHQNALTYQEMGSKNHTDKHAGGLLLHADSTETGTSENKQFEKMLENTRRRVTRNYSDETHRFRLRWYDWFKVFAPRSPRHNDLVDFFANVSALLQRDENLDEPQKIQVLYGVLVFVNRSIENENNLMFTSTLQCIVRELLDKYKAHLTSSTLTEGDDACLLDLCQFLNSKKNIMDTEIKSSVSEMVKGRRLQ